MSITLAIPPTAETDRWNEELDAWVRKIVGPRHDG
jgi:hypothetical protein